LKLLVLQLDYGSFASFHCFPQCFGKNAAAVAVAVAGKAIVLDQIAVADVKYVFPLGAILP
jgi:hypothetical protein